MKRAIMQKLLKWKASTRRKPLILMGARQVGKTTILKAFAKAHYDNVVYLNFEDEPRQKQLFEGSLKPGSILTALRVETGEDILPEKTLIVLDEAQLCPNAINSLKYFNEDANDYHICAAGSLLGVKLKHAQGFPVGKVNFLDMFPMSFVEFLDAIDETKLCDYLGDIDEIKPLPGSLHDKCLNYFKHYCFVGGMPEAVSAFAEMTDFHQVREIQNDILRAYSLDFAKHALPEQVMKISQIWQVVPSQLAKENKKFIYSAIRKGARAKEYEVAIQWLKEAGLVHKTYNVSKPGLPLKSCAHLDYFKLYCLDVGLLGSLSTLPAQVIVQGNTLFTEFRGAFIENVVAQSLASHHQELYYWSSEGKAELDFVGQFQEQIIPIEVKSGTSDKKKSLRVYIDKYKPNLAVRCSPMNLKCDGGILNCPLYMLDQLETLIALAVK